MEPRVGEIRGWRSWRFPRWSSSTLRSLVADESWPPGVLTAKCDPDGAWLVYDCERPAGPPPHKVGSCGIYATRTLPVLLHHMAVEGTRLYMIGRGEMLFGAVDLWGIVRESDNGVYRAQYARPVTLLRTWWDEYGGRMERVLRRYTFAVEEPPDMLREALRVAAERWQWCESAGGGKEVTS